MLLHAAAPGHPWLQCPAVLHLVRCGSRLPLPHLVALPVTPPGACELHQARRRNHRGGLDAHSVLVKRKRMALLAGTTC